MKFLVGDAMVTAATGARSLDGDDPLVVMVHGAGMDRTIWSQQTRYLAHHGFRAAAVDVPGHGTSEGEPLPTIEAIGEWLLDVIDALGGSAHLVGHSMGALAALHAAGVDADKASGRVMSLSLLGVGMAMPVHPALLAAAQDNDALADQLITAWGHGKRQHIGRNPTPGLWMLGGGVAMLDGTADGVLATDLVGCNAYVDVAEAASRVRCRSLVIAGDSDRMTPSKSGQAVAEHLADASFVELADTGHTMMLERPAEVRQLLLAHLAG